MQLVVLPRKGFRESRRMCREGEVDGLQGTMGYQMKGNQRPIRGTLTKDIYHTPTLESVI